MAFAEDENVIETLAPDRADEPLRERLLPQAVRRREDFLDPHALHVVSLLSNKRPFCSWESGATAYDTWSRGRPDPHRSFSAPRICREPVTKPKHFFTLKMVASVQ